jgi:hypothetical protein
MGCLEADDDLRVVTAGVACVFPSRGESETPRLLDDAVDTHRYRAAFGPVQG